VTAEGSATGTPGPLDERYEALVRERFERLTRTNPVYATFLGLHDGDGELADLSRDALEAELAAEKRSLAELEALDDEGLSAMTRLERELAVLAVRRSIFDHEVHRTWERRVTATDEIGEGLFVLLARDFAPLEERLVSMTSRLEQAPRVLREVRTRLGDRPQRLWNELELESAAGMPALFDEAIGAARSVWADDAPELRRLQAAAAAATEALGDYRGWLGEQLARADDDFALGRERYDELIALRAFDGLTTDEILAIGWRQLEENHEGRRRAAREVDPAATEAEVLDRIKSDHPRTFEEALDAYRSSMERAKRFVVERGLATLPPDERLDVIPTPEYMRNVLPFAAYFSPARFDAQPKGNYIVTPSVDGDPGAMREHNHASISNTSIHEAYPGHHLQLSAAMKHPSLIRLMTDAPEFVEGWGMYSEQMMREEGFDATPEHHVILYTDAIWRACRIILDIRLHRGEISVPDAIDFLVEHTGFERPNATAEVNRYTSTPTYQLSYLLGKVLLLRLREDERRRLGDRFSLRAFHDALLYAGSLPVSFHRRLLAGEGASA
jgi:uncharacterized protein (DUF885 family)